MKNFLQNAAKKAILCLFLTASLLLCACTFVIPLPTMEPTTTTTPSVDDYALLLKQGALNKTENPACFSVADWLVYWGAVFDDAKFELIESVFAMYSVYEIGEPFDIAQSCVELYCAYCVDYAPLSDVRVQTDLWLYCYTYSIGDPYANYYSQEDLLFLKEEESGQYAGIGVSMLESTDPVGALVVEVFENSPAKAAGIMVGDVIVAVDGVSISSIGYEVAANGMKGDVGTSIEITIDRAGEIITFTLVRALIDTPVVTYKMIEQGNAQIGYIYISTFSNALVAQQFKEAVDALVDGGADALLFDVRHNGGGYLYQVLDMLDYLLVDGKPLMRAGYYDGSEEVILGDDGHSVDLPFGLLCSDYSASASEIFISTIKDYCNAGDCEAFSVGIQTYGKGCMQYLLEFSDATAAYMTIGYFDPPYSASYDGIGITPDYVVELAPEYQYVNVSSIPEGFDTQLAKALEILAGE